MFTYNTSTNQHSLTLPEDGRECSSIIQYCFSAGIAVSRLFFCFVCFFHTPVHCKTAEKQLGWEAQTHIVRACCFTKTGIAKSFRCGCWHGARFCVFEEEAGIAVKCYDETQDIEVPSKPRGWPNTFLGAWNEAFALDVCYVIRQSCPSCITNILAVQWCVIKIVWVLIYREYGNKGHTIQYTAGCKTQQPMDASHWLISKEKNVIHIK